MYHCTTHDIDHRSYDCPRCEAERRHEELLEQARESHEEELRYAHERHEDSIEAARKSDHRRANPGDYECPHCMFISLKRYATRCPLCHGSPDANYWSKIEAREEVARERAKAAAIEQARLGRIAADERAAEAERHRRKAAAEAEQHRRKAAARRSLAGLTVVVLIVAWIFAWPPVRRKIMKDFLDDKSFVEKCIKDAMRGGATEGSLTLHKDVMRGGATEARAKEYCQCGLKKLNADADLLEAAAACRVPSDSNRSPPPRRKYW